MHKKTIPSAAAAMLFVLAPASHAWAEAYQLNFNPPREVGDTFQLQGNGSSSSEVFTRVNGQNVHEETSYHESRVHANGEVLALNDLGGVSQVAYQLIEYEIEIDSEAIELDTTQRLVATVADGEVIFAYEDGSAIDAAYYEALALLLDDPLDSKADGNDTNRVMNAQDPREVGEDWEMDHAFMAQQLSSDGKLLVNPDDMRSNITLVRVAPNDAGVSMAAIEAEMTATNLRASEGQFPEFLKVTDSNVHVQMNGTLSIDPGSHYGTLNAEMEMALLVKGKSPDGQVIEIEIEFERETEVAYSPVEN